MWVSNLLPCRIWTQVCNINSYLNFQSAHLLYGLQTFQAPRSWGPISLKESHVCVPFLAPLLWRTLASTLPSSFVWLPSFLTGPLPWHWQNGIPGLPVLQPASSPKALEDKSHPPPFYPLHLVLLTHERWPPLSFSFLLDRDHSLLGFLSSPTPDRFLLAPWPVSLLAFSPLGDEIVSETRHYLFLAAWDSGWCPDGRVFLHSWILPLCQLCARPLKSTIHTLLK